jgi:cell division cycle 14
MEIGLGQFAEIVVLPDHVIFSVFKATPSPCPGRTYYSLDDEPSFEYKPFFDDFGPLSLLQIHKFSVLSARLLQTARGVVVFWCAPDLHRIANAAFLLSAFRMIHLKCTPKVAFTPFLAIAPRLPPYRDASSLPSTYDLSVFSCLCSLHRAITLRWYVPDAFDADSWQQNELVANGDMNWIIPNKLLGLASPYDRKEVFDGWFVATPAEIIPKFKQMGINHVIRVSKPFYDPAVFTEAGIRHTEMYFVDGSVPSPDLVKRFLDIMASDDVIALHCQAGLGRTYVWFEKTNTQWDFGGMCSHQILRVYIE